MKSQKKGKTAKEQKTVENGKESKARKRKILIGEKKAVKNALGKKAVAVFQS